jgi:hypothetical protein
MNEPTKQDLISMANEVNDYVAGYGNKHTELGIKELKKFEMYLRKAFIMYRMFTDVADGTYYADEDWLKKVNAMLQRDFNHIKQRDNMGSYEI